MVREVIGYMLLRHAFGHCFSTAVWKEELRKALDTDRLIAVRTTAPTLVSFFDHLTRHATTKCRIKRSSTRTSEFVI